MLMRTKTHEKRMDQLTKIGDELFLNEVKGWKEIVANGKKIYERNMESAVISHEGELKLLKEILAEKDLAIKSLEDSNSNLETAYNKADKRARETEEAVEVLNNVVAMGNIAILALKRIVHVLGNFCVLKQDARHKQKLGPAYKELMDEILFNKKFAYDYENIPREEEKRDIPENENSEIQ